MSMTMKNFFTAIALLSITLTVAIYIAGAISASNKKARAAYENVLKIEVENMAEVMKKANEEIERLTLENAELKASQKVTPTKSTKTTPSTTSSKPQTTGTVLTKALVLQHSKENDCWIIVSNKVYSVASYISMHPGGRSTIINQCGKDATTVFANRGGTGKHSGSAYTMLGTYLIGTLGASVKL
jgi:cytochrome b involved in lipid metabolism